MDSFNIALLCQYIGEEANNQRESQRPNQNLDEPIREQNQVTQHSERRNGDSREDDQREPRSEVQGNINQGHDHGAEVRSRFPTSHQAVRHHQTEAGERDSHTGEVNVRTVRHVNEDRGNVGALTMISVRLLLSQTSFSVSVTPSTTLGELRQ